MSEVIRKRRRRDNDCENNMNCRCVTQPVPNHQAIIDAIARTILMFDNCDALKMYYTPERILKSKNTTVVFWIDGTKTVVKCNPETVPDDYGAFTAALAIKIYGSNSQLKKVLKEKTVIQEIKPKKLVNTPETCNKDYSEYEKDEYIRMVDERSAAVENELIETQLALCDVYELINGVVE